LVVAVGIDGQLAEEFAGCCVDDADVQVLGEQDDVGSGVGSSDADVTELTVDGQGDGAVRIGSHPTGVRTNHPSTCHLGRRGEAHDHNTDLPAGDPGGPM
jgi:hypothetical protein